jgi:phage gp36-like protein
VAYAVLTDITNFGIVASALSSLPDDVKLAALDAASVRVDGYLRSRYKLPLTAWGQDIVEATVVIAVWILMSRRGFMPAAGSDALIRERYLDTLQWLNRVGRQEVQPDVKPTSAEDSSMAAPRVTTATARGW